MTVLIFSVRENIWISEDVNANFWSHLSVKKSENDGKTAFTGRIYDCRCKHLGSTWRRYLMQFTKFLKITKISPSEANYEDLSNEVDNGAPIETCNGEKSLQANVKGKAVADNNFFFYFCWQFHRQFDERNQRVDRSCKEFAKGIFLSERGNQTHSEPDRELCVMSNRSCWPEHVLTRKSMLPRWQHWRFILITMLEVWL